MYRYEAKKFVEGHPKNAIQYAKKIDNIHFETGLGPLSDEDAVLTVMNEMCHQKIKAGQKWGAISMIPYTINQVYSVVDQSKFPNRNELLSILNKWKEDDFSTVDIDHKDILALQDGNIGKAYGKLSFKEEAEFILENFGSKLN